MEKIMMYCGDSFSKEAVEAAGTALHMTVCLIDDQDLHQTLGYLAGRDGFTSSKEDMQPSHFSDAFMILVDIEDERIGDLMEYFKSIDTPYQGAKAVITEHNQHWTMRALFQEIQEEHAYFQAYGSLQRALQAVNQFDQKAYTEESWTTFQGILLETYLTYQARVESIDEINQARKQLQEGIEQLELKKQA